MGEAHIVIAEHMISGSVEFTPALKEDSIAFMGAAKIAKLANEIAKTVVDIAKCEDKSVSVAFEEVTPEEWPETVYRPDILETKLKLYKKPGYDPFEA